MASVRRGRGRGAKEEWLCIVPVKYPDRVPLWIRIILLLPLVGIAALIYWAGQQSRDGLFKSQLFASGTPPDVGRYVLHPPVYLPGSDFRLVDTIQVYAPENLYEKINGHDGAFLRFDVVALTFASYGRDGNIGLDLYAYRMDRRENALGVFAGERTRDRTNLDIRDAGYESGGALFFYRGPWYFQITPSTQNDETVQAAVRELADSLMAIVPAPEKPIAELNWFPGEGRIANSEGFFPNNAFATDFIGEVFTADYEAAEGTIRAFRHRSDSAAQMYRRYAEFLTSVATPEGTLTLNSTDILRFSAYGEETWIANWEDNLLGLSGVSDVESARTLMAALVRRARAVEGEI